MLLFNESEMGFRNLHFNMCFSLFQSCRPCHSEKSGVGVLGQDHIAIERGGDFPVKVMEVFSLSHPGQG